jgi:hypothetical protein
MSVKDGVRELIGRTITRVIVAENPRQPNTQVFLVLNDGTYYEFYGSVNSASGSMPGGAEDAARYAMEFGGKITKFD